MEAEGGVEIKVSKDKEEVRVIDHGVRGPSGHLNIRTARDNTSHSSLKVYQGLVLGPQMLTMSMA